jgi:hypothetical protein
MDETTTTHDINAVRLRAVHEAVHDFDTICSRNNVRSASSVGDFHGLAKKLEALWQEKREGHMAKDDETPWVESIDSAKLAQK